LPNVSQRSQDKIRTEVRSWMVYWTRAKFYRKHELRHTKPFICQIAGCYRTEGFSTVNDLDRHTKSKHPSALQGLQPTKRYRCHVQGCKSKEKLWPRLDNFRSHLKRVHQKILATDEEFEEMVRRLVGSNLDPSRCLNLTK
jgi:hypothetical protein